MKQTKYLTDVLKYYRENDTIPGDPNEGRWEDAHTPYPRGMANDTIPLLHEHHIVHDLWQSAELDHPHFYPKNAQDVLYSSSFWPSNWFELCDIFDRYTTKLKSLGGKSSKPGNTFETYSKAGKIGGKKSQKTLKERGLGVYDPATQLKASKKGGQVSNSLRYECLVTGFQSTGPSLSKYQNARGIDTKLRKRIS